MRAGIFRWSKSAARLGIAALCVSALAACSAVYRNHGWTPEEDELSALVVGVDTRESVEAQIGQPTAAGVVGENAWYYVSSRNRHWAYRAPETIERELLAVSFTPDGTLENIERFGLEDGQVVTLSRRVTETTIKEFGLIQQLLRNFGQINVGEALSNN